MAKAVTDLQFLQYLVEIVYPRYNTHCFLIYMVINYWDVLKQQQTFTLQAVSGTFLANLVGKSALWDVDNTVVVNDNVEQNSLKCAVFNCNLDDKIIRKVHVISKRLDNKFVAFVSNNLLHNVKNAASCNFGRWYNKSLNFAEDVELSLVSTSVDWSQQVIDNSLRNFFSTPKLLYQGDIIVVDLRKYGKDLFYMSHKLSDIKAKLYFKCNKVNYKGRPSTDGHLCSTDKSTLRQTTNIQSFIPKKIEEVKDCDSIPLCPTGLDSYFQSVKRAVLPFLNQNRPNFSPIFLLEGHKGVGKRILVECVSSHFGMHLHTINNFDISANVYAQNEIKLKNIIFGAKMTAPSILEIRNFENFGKNNEGEYDDRLISHFISEIKNLFVGNTFPIVVFCCSNEKNVPVELKRVFLKIFEIKAPTDSERESMLSWIVKSLDIKTDADSSGVANKAHGFVFEDLRALTHYALTEFSKEGEEIVLEKSFLKALDFMQSNYNDSLGAPKVPQVKWDDVGGLNDVKEEIIKTIKLPLRHPHLLKSTGLKRSGILLFGPPGTGKTLIAKAVATECGLCFLSVKGPELLNMYVGQSEQNVRDVFQRARDASPCIIFFDELDSLAPNRGASGDSGGVMDRVVSQLLAEMDGLNQTGTVFIIGATNRPDLIDPALLRPGRIDKLLYVGPCLDRDSKISVLRALTRKFHLESDSVIEDVVRFCPENYSGADFYGVCSNAWMSALRREITKPQNETKDNGNRLTPKDIIVTAHDFELAITSVKPSIRQEDLEYFRKLQAESK